MITTDNTKRLIDYVKDPSQLFVFEVEYEDKQWDRLEYVFAEIFDPVERYFKSVENLPLNEVIEGSFYFKDGTFVKIDNKHKIWLPRKYKTLPEHLTVNHRRFMRLVEELPVELSDNGAGLIETLFHVSANAGDKINAYVGEDGWNFYLEQRGDDEPLFFLHYVDEKNFEILLDK